MPGTVFHPIRHVLALTLMVHTTACALGDAGAEPEFAIVSPAEGDRIGTNAVRVQGVVNDRAIRTVFVNGEAVPVSTGEFQTSLRLADGPARIEAVAGDLVDAVEIWVDGRAPRVIIEEPVAGSFIEGDSIRVRGRVEDASDATVTVEGERIAVDARGAFAFDRTVAPGAHRIRVVAEDAVGHVGSSFTTAIVGDFGDVDATISRAMSLAFGEAALDAIGSVAAAEMSPENVLPLLMTANPVAGGFWGEVNTTGEDHDPVSVAVTPGVNALNLRVMVPNLAVPFEVDLPLGLYITGTTYVETAVITATTAVGADGGMPLIDLTSSDVMLEGVFIDVDGLWDWVDRALITRALRGTIERSLNDAVANEVPPAIERALAALPTARVLEIRGYRAEVLGAIADLTASPLGLLAVLDFGVRPIGGVGGAMRSAPGPLVLGSGSEPASMLPGVEGAVTVDLVNAALFSAWSVGGLSYRMEEVPGPGGRPLDVALVNIILPVEGASRDALVAVEVDATLPPIVRQTPTGLEMHAADLRVRLYAPTSTGDVLLANISCGVRAVVTPILGDDGLDLIATELDLTVDGIGELRGLPPATDLDQILGELLAPWLREHGELRGLSVPSVGGFDIGADAVFVEDGYVVFQGQLTAQ